VPGFSTASGTQLDLWDCNGGGNQSWNWEDDGTVTVYGSKCLAIGGTGGAAGDPVIIADCTGADSQKWTLNAGQTVTSVAVPALCLEAVGGATGNGTSIGVGTCAGGTGQAWTKA
jgi:hypothetical protein